jgi:stage II sporulation SpoE-like protein
VAAIRSSPAGRARLRELPDAKHDVVSRVGDASELLQELVSHRLPEALLREAQAAGAESVAVYVMDIDGSRLIRLAGQEPFPGRIPVSLGLGPELPAENLRQVEEIVSSKVPGACLIPMWIRDRAVGVLVTSADRSERLEHLASQAALALELAGGYTDVVHRTRRRKEVNPAAEIQQNLLPPRIAAFASADVAGGVLPGYEIGGDFFDYADNDDGLWLAVGDAIGKGNTAASISSLAVGALRAARRNDATLEQAASVVHQACFDLGGPYQFLTAVFAVWHQESRILAWINCGHPAPVLIDADGAITELTGDGTHPIGLFRRQRTFRRSERRLEPEQRILLYSDGVAEHRDPKGNEFGLKNLGATLRTCTHATAAGAVRSLQDAVLGFSPRPLRDDATLLLVDTH